MPAHDIATSQFLEPAVMTTPGAFAPLLAGLPAGIAAVAQALHGLLIHEHMAGAYGVTLTQQDRASVHIRPVAGLLGQIAARDRRPLTVGRAPASRLAGNCRHFTVLAVAALRAQGTPARARCGFGGYFGSGAFKDHRGWRRRHRDVRFPPGIAAGGRHAEGMTHMTRTYDTSEAAGTDGFFYQAIVAEELDALRAAGRDKPGNPLHVQVDRDGGAPLRCCLREARPGERLLLIAYTPPGTAGAYAERGPVFVHAERCDGYLTPHRYPPEFAHRQQVVRAYDEQGRIAAGVLAADGRQAQSVIAELLARPEVELVHLRNVGYGCYNCAVRVRTD